MYILAHPAPPRRAAPRGALEPARGSRGSSAWCGSAALYIVVGSVLALVPEDACALTSTQ